MERNAGVVSTVAGGSSSGYVDGIGTVAKFQAVYHIALNSVGDLIVCDGPNNAIRKISSDGVWFLQK